MKTQEEIKFIACNEARALSISLRKPDNLLMKYLAIGLESIVGAVIDGYHLFYCKDGYWLEIDTASGHVITTVDHQHYYEYAFVDETFEKETLQRLTQLIALYFIVPDDTQETIRAKAEAYTAQAHDADAPSAPGTPLMRIK